LEQEVGIEFEFVARTPLQRGRHRRAIAVGGIIVDVDERGVADRAEARDVAAENRLRDVARRIEEFEVGVRPFDQESDIADTRLPPLAEQQVRIDAQLLRLLPVHAADASRDAVALEI